MSGGISYGGRVFPATLRREDWDVQAVVPSDPVQGSVYFDSGANRYDGAAGLRFYDGAGWRDIPGQSGGELTTPLITDGTNPFTMNVARSYWVRTGATCRCSIYLDWTSKGSASGAIKVTGALPQTAKAVSSTFYTTGAVAGLDGVQVAANYEVGLRIADASDEITLLKSRQSVDTPIALLQASELAATGTLYISLEYDVSGAFP